MSAPNTPSALPSPGWYPDPSGKPGQRYFDGIDWTDQHAPTLQQMPDAQRAERLAQAVTIEVSRGAHVETQGPFHAVIVFPPPKCNHVLHFLLMWLTCFLWLIFWAIDAGRREQRFLLQVDPYGVVTRTKAV